MSRLSIQNDEFILDGKKITILSGAIHYFRVFPEYWEDRLLKLKACGLNTVETYIPWNVHEPRQGEFCFEGMYDMARFITLAQKLGLMVIARPSPYICSEWDFGGLPSWLLKDPEIRLRCCNTPFLSKVDAYYDVLMPILKQLQSTNGGPVIAVQVENEYGSYGNDAEYLEYLKNAMIRRGIDVPLFTSDGDSEFLLQCGTLPDVLKTENFGSGPEGAFEILRKYQKTGPLMCAEFWVGWFDHWGEEHHTREAADVAETFEKMLKLGASVNFYMFHGGTNFGFMSGANCYDKYEPDTTSYDCDALLNEAGEPTDKYFAVKEVIARRFGADDSMMPKSSAKAIYPDVKMTGRAGLFDSLTSVSAAIKSVCPEPMEHYGQDYGFILYETYVQGPRGGNELIIQDLHDRAMVFVNGEYKGVLERWNNDGMILFDIDERGAKISVLVENMGRVNYGPHLKDYKGVTEGIRLGNQLIYHWDVYCLPLTNLSGLNFKPEINYKSEPDSKLGPDPKIEFNHKSVLEKKTGLNHELELEPKTELNHEPGLGPKTELNNKSELDYKHGESQDPSKEIDVTLTGNPIFYKGILKINNPVDTFVSMEGWTKGVVFINGFNLGRYWNVGPQKALYLPAPLLRHGDNELIVFELHGMKEPVVRFANGAY